MLPQIPIVWLEARDFPASQLEDAIRQSCKDFLLILENYTQTGIARFTVEESLNRLRAKGFNVPDSPTKIPKEMPRFDDEGNGLSFFKTRIDPTDFDDLTVPRTLFLRSEITGCRFQNTDLSDSSMTWCDWKNCMFMKSDLTRCDLRKSIFNNCEFYGANLDGADLRGTQLIKCRFHEANMKGTKLEKESGLLAMFGRPKLKLSKEQTWQIEWSKSTGEETPGG